MGKALSEACRGKSFAAACYSVGECVTCSVLPRGDSCCFRIHGHLSADGAKGSVVHLRQHTDSERYGNTTRSD
eukprot:3398903-Amphidinium_carterae.1